MATLSSVIYSLIALAWVVFFYVRHRFGYWKKQGIPHDPPDSVFGSLNGVRITRHFRDIMQENYEKFKRTGPFGGFFFFLNPAVVVYDLDLARDILIKDFHKFTDRGMFHNERDDPLTAHLFNLDGARWKHMRNKLSPTFTSGKMKYMFPTMLSVGDRLLETLDQVMKESPVLEVKDLLARFTVDVIGTCAFGIDCNSLKDPSAEFRAMCGRAFRQTRHSKIIDGLLFCYPDLARRLRMRQIHEDVHQFFMRVVRETVEFREKNSITRNDFMNLLIELKNSGEGMTIEEVAAQAFVFFLAGFETSSTTMGFALFELAINQGVQDKLRAEISEQFEKHDGKFTYECISEMPYMEKVIKETLRKYSVVISLIRKCLEDYPTANPKYVIPKGAMIFIPADAIHRDPDLYPDPEKFDPERFSPENLHKRHPSSWLAFGDGPRHCIGLRFGKMQTFIGLALLLRSFRFHYCDRTPYPLEMDLTTAVLASKGGIYLRAERIK